MVSDAVLPIETFDVWSFVGVIATKPGNAALLLLSSRRARSRLRVAATPERLPRYTILVLRLDVVGLAGNAFSVERSAIA